MRSNLISDDLVRHGVILHILSLQAIFLDQLRAGRVDLLAIVRLKVVAVLDFELRASSLAFIVKANHIVIIVSVDRDTDIHI